MERTQIESNCNKIISQNDLYFHGDWYECFSYGDCFNSGFAIEWLKVYPCHLIHRRILIEPEIIDADREFEDILKKYSIPYEMESDVYCIYGYE